MKDLTGIFPARSRWLRLIKLFFRKPSKRYDRQYYDAPNGTYGGYGFRAGMYDHAVACLTGEFAGALTVLEIGCAKGHVLVHLQRIGMIVAGIEVSRYAREHAHPEVKDKITAGWPEGQFDLVLCKEVLPHMSQRQAMATVKKAMEVGRQCYFVIQVAETPLQAWLMKKWDPTHRTLKPAKWWRAKLEKLGYQGHVEFKRLF